MVLLLYYFGFLRLANFSTNTAVRTDKVIYTFMIGMSKEYHIFKSNSFLDYARRLSYAISYFLEHLRSMSFYVQYFLMKKAS